MDEEGAVPALVRLGWEFYPTGPDEFSWLKFDDKDKVVGVQDDGIWLHDYAVATEGRD